MKGVLSRRGKGSGAELVSVDSCGTGGGSRNWYKPGGFSYHEGDDADSRMTEAAARRGLDVCSISRPLSQADFENGKEGFLVAMDDENLREIAIAREYWAKQDGGAAGERIRDENAFKAVLLSEYSSDKSFRGRGVPDPWYSGKDGFEHALDLIEGACEGLADSVLERVHGTSNGNR
jgi:protein-tyrosine phosphatase